MPTATITNNTADSVGSGCGLPAANEDSITPSTTSLRAKNAATPTVILWVPVVFQDSGEDPVGGVDAGDVGIFEIADVVVSNQVQAGSLFTFQENITV